MKKRYLPLILLAFLTLTACDFSSHSKIPVTGVNINQAEISISVDEQTTLSATVLPENATDKEVTWSIANSAIATINSATGLVTGMSEGDTTVTVTTHDGGHTDTCSIRVNNPSELWDSSQDSLRNGSKILDFYSLNDFHGATEYDNESSYEPGIKKLSTYLNNAKATNPNGFVLTSSGDMWQGSADSNITRGRLVNDWMSLIDFSAMNLGNHEFDWTIDVIKSNQALAGFPLLSCNIIDDDTGQPVDWIDPYTTITKNGVHIGIIGAIGEGITSDILASNVEGLTFADPEPYVVNWASYLRTNGADVILYLLHDTVGNISTAEGNAVDVIFGGHSHQGENTIENNPYVSYSTPALQAWSNGKDVGHFNMTYSFVNEEVASCTAEILDTRSFKISSLADDPATSSMYQTYLDNEISAIKDEVKLADGPGIAKGDIPNVYNQYAYRYFKDFKDAANDYNIFMVQTNNARAAIASGDITYGMIYKALPFDNSLCLVTVKGSDIVNELSWYGFFYLPSQNSQIDGSNLSSYLNLSSTYYVLMIDYIALNVDFRQYVTMVKTYGEEEALPRNIVSRYISGYPSNIH